MKRLMMLLVGMSLPTLAGYTYEVQDGDYFEAISLENNQSMLVAGGGGYHLNLWDSSQAVIQNTSPLVEGAGGIWQIRVGGYSEISILGGEIQRLTVGSYALAKISGGQIDQIYSSQDATLTKHIEIICKAYDYNITTKKLTGSWGDNSLFSIQLMDMQGYSPTIENIRFTIIPEPVTLLLLGLGGVFLRRRQ